jgi:hypothetical protein
MSIPRVGRPGGDGSRADGRRGECRVGFLCAPPFPTVGNGGGGERWCQKRSGGGGQERGKIGVFPHSHEAHTVFSFIGRPLPPPWVGCGLGAPNGKTICAGRKVTLRRPTRTFVLAPTSPKAVWGPFGASGHALRGMFYMTIYMVCVGRMYHHASLHVVGSNCRDTCCAVDRYTPNCKKALCCCFSHHSYCKPLNAAYRICNY